MKHKPSVKDKLRGLRLTHLIQSLGWDGAREHLAKLSPAEKSDYVAPAAETRE